MRGGRGSNNNSRRGPNPLTRSYESNGPDVKVRGTPQHIAEKYVQLARDAHSSGDTVMAESYLQHAEHYYRIIAAAQNAQQQAWNQANGVAQTEVEQVEDEDEFEVVGADRFTFRAPQSYMQPQGGPGAQNGVQTPQPFQPGQAYDAGYGDQPPVMEGQPQPGAEGVPTPYQPQQPRGDRPFGNRRFDERNGRRFGRDRGDRGDRGDRNFGDRAGGERGPNAERQSGERQTFQPRQDEAAESGAEERILPSFITAPTRSLQVEAAPAEVSVDAGGAEAGFRRRRLRGRPGASAEGQTGGDEE
jgi:hypothetical protein